jgi:hypothetical protein
MLYNGKNAVVAMILAVSSIVFYCSAAFGQAVVTDTKITDQTIQNECNGEQVLLNGTLHQETNFSTTPSGSTHASFNATIQLNGYGQITGAYYVAKDNTHQETNTKGIAQEQFFSTKIRLVAQGPTPDMVDRATLHVVIDKNGVVKIDISKHQISCK